MLAKSFLRTAGRERRGRISKSREKIEVIDTTEPGPYDMIVFGPEEAQLTANLVLPQIYHDLHRKVKAHWKFVILDVFCQGELGNLCFIKVKPSRSSGYLDESLIKSRLKAKSS